MTPAAQKRRRVSFSAKKIPDVFFFWYIPGLVITGIRLRPGACRAVLGCPAERLVNGSVLLGDIATGATELHCRLLLSDNLYTRLALLESWVRFALERATANDRAVIAACRVLGANPKIEIGDVARRLDWNARMIWQYQKEYQLPHHPLESSGYVSAHSAPIGGAGELAGSAAPYREDSCSRPSNPSSTSYGAAFSGWSSKRARSKYWTR